MTLKEMISPLKLIQFIKLLRSILDGECPEHHAYKCKRNLTVNTAAQPSSHSCLVAGARDKFAAKYITT